MTTKRGVAALMLSIMLCAGCVTQTERVPYRRYGPPEDEGVMTELRRELGGVKKTVSGWFHKDKTPESIGELQESRRRFEQEQQEAFRRLHERQEQEQGPKNQD